MLKNGPTSEEKQLNGENKGPNKNEDVLIKVLRVASFLNWQNLFNNIEGLGRKKVV